MTAVRAIVTIGLAGIFLLIVGPPMFEAPPTIYTGVHLRVTGALVQPDVVDVDRGSPAYRAGVRSGDVLSCLSRKDYILIFAPAVMGRSAAYVPGTIVHACAVRSGTMRRFAFSGDARASNGIPYYTTTLTVLRLLEYVAFLLCGIALVLARPGIMSWIFYAFCLASDPDFAFMFHGVSLPAPLYAIATDSTHIVERIGTGLLLLFALLVPEDRASGWRDIAYKAAWAVVACFAIFMAFAQFDTAVTMVPPLYGGIDLSLSALTILIVIARLFAMRSDERARFGWAALAIIWGVIFNFLRSTSGVFGLDVSSQMIAGLLTFVMPVLLTYAILKRHVIDVRFVISRTVVYAVITTIVVGLIGVVDWATSAYLSELRAALAIDAAVTIALGFVLHRAYALVDRVVDVLLFREKRAAELYLERLAKTLPFAKSEDVVSHAVVSGPYEKLALTAAALFREQNGTFVPAFSEGWSLDSLPTLDNDHDVPRFLMAERSRITIDDLHARMQTGLFSSAASPAFAVPIFQSNDLTAFALYGLHRDGTQLDPDEQHALERLCETAAQAYTAIELARYRAATRAIPAMETL